MSLGSLELRFYIVPYSLNFRTQEKSSFSMEHGNIATFLENWLALLCMICWRNSLPRKITVPRLTVIGWKRLCFPHFMRNVYLYTLKEKTGKIEINSFVKKFSWFCSFFGHPVIIYFTAVYRCFTFSGPLTD